MITFGGNPLLFGGDYLVTGANPVPEVNNLTPNRIYSQYRTDPSTVKWYQITPTLGEQIRLVLERIRTSWDIDQATPYELDVLERIVVVKQRVNPTSIPPGLDLTKIRRMLIKAKIAKNSGDGTADSIYKAVRYITDIDQMVIEDNDNMSFNIFFQNALSPETTYILNNYDIIPRAQGVKFAGYADVTGYSQFGDTDAQFGDTDTQFSYLFGGTS